MNHQCFNTSATSRGCNTDSKNTFVYLWWNTADMCVQTTHLSLCMNAIIINILIFIGTQYTGLMNYQPGQRTPLLPLVWESLHLLQCNAKMLYHHLCFYLSSFKSCIEIVSTELTPRLEQLTQSKQLSHFTEESRWLMWFPLKLLKEVVNLTI